MKSEELSARSHPGWAAIVLVVLTIVAYSSVGSLGFVTLDDPQYLLDNPQVSEGLTWPGVQWAFTSAHASNWHPLTWISHMMDVQIFGQQAGPHHLVNLLLHLVNTLLLFALLYRMTGATGRSALVAALFALHPLHVESVAWVSERKDVLSTLFFMLTLGAYSSYVRKPLVRRYLVVFIFLALGLMAKPMLVTLPFVLLLLDIWPLQRFSLDSLDWHAAARLVIEKLPLFALIIISSIITFLVQQEGGAVTSLDSAPLYARLSNVLVSYTVYIGNMFWPTGLAVMYPIPKEFPLWQPAGAFIALLMMSFAVVKFARRYPYLPVGWFWYLGTLVPVIGIVQVGTQAMADRYTYIPLTGLFIIIAWGGYDMLIRHSTKRAPIAVLAVMILASMTIATWLQVQYWRDSKTLWTRALEVTGGNFRAQVAYGSLLAEEGRHEEAAKHFSAAIRIQPNYAEAHNKLGVTFAETGRHEDAIFHYKEALRIRPDLTVASNNLGNALAAVGRAEDSVTHFQQVLDFNNDDPMAHNNLGSALDDMGRVDEAIVQYQKALELNPKLAAAHNNLAAAYARKEWVDQAANEMEAALLIEPDNATYHYNYAILISRQGQTELARQHLKTALSINPSLDNVREALAVLPAEDSEETN